MIDNTGLLRELLTKGKICLRNSNMLTECPLHLPKDFDFERVEGMLLGLAIGDALGATSEGNQPAKRHDLYGEIRDYIPGQHSNNKAVGVATDDTQLAFRTLEQLITDGGLIPNELAYRFCEGGIVGIGSAVKEFIANYKGKHMQWYDAGVDSLGNGALMQIAPIIVPFLRNPHPSLYADAALATMITHNAYANIASCVAFVKILWLLLGMTSPPEPRWWIDTFCSTAKQLEGNTLYHPPKPRHVDYEGPLWRRTAHVCNDALSKRLSVEEACDSWGSGADLFETVPSVLYILATHANNAEEAIIRAVNDTVDSDTIGAIVGAAVGALHGLTGIPERWVKNLTGIIRKGGTGQVFRLIFHAKQVFWLQNSSIVTYNFHNRTGDKSLNCYPFE